MDKIDYSQIALHGISVADGHFILQLLDGYVERGISSGELLPLGILRKRVMDALSAMSDRIESLNNTNNDGEDE
jgi:hypothetical protein